MPKRITPLSPSQIDELKSKDKEYKISDGFGLYILVTPAGSRLWRYNYRFNGIKKTLAFGSYPQISIEDARTMRSDAQNQLKDGIDPSVTRKTQIALKNADNNSSSIQASIRIVMDDYIEIWKGRLFVRLSCDEASFIKNQLCKLID
jgi:hypothetical protein